MSSSRSSSAPSMAANNTPQGRGSGSRSSQSSSLHQRQRMLYVPKSVQQNNATGQQLSNVSSMGSRNGLGTGKSGFEASDDDAAPPGFDQHDAGSEDMLMESSQTSGRGRRSSNRGTMAAVEKEDDTDPNQGWEYQDPDGRLQGPFPTRTMVNWHKQNYFPEDLKVRWVSRDQITSWRPLSQVLETYANKVQSGTPGKGAKSYAAASARKSSGGESAPMGTPGKSSSGKGMESRRTSEVEGRSQMRRSDIGGRGPDQGGRTMGRYAESSRSLSDDILEGPAPGFSKARSSKTPVKLHSRAPVEADWGPEGVMDSEEEGLSDDGAEEGWESELAEAPPRGRARHQIVWADKKDDMRLRGRMAHEPEELWDDGDDSCSRRSADEPYMAPKHSREATGKPPLASRKPSATPSSHRAPPGMDTPPGSDTPTASPRVGVKATVSEDSVASEFLYTPKKGTPQEQHDQQSRSASLLIDGELPKDRFSREMKRILGRLFHVKVQLSEEAQQKLRENPDNPYAALANEVVWKYAESERDKIQGPYSGSKMVARYFSNELTHYALVCGCHPQLDRTVRLSRVFFRPLGELLTKVAAGGIYKPVGNEDIVLATGEPAGGLWHPVVTATGEPWPDDPSTEQFRRPSIPVSSVGVRTTVGGTLGSAGVQTVPVQSTPTAPVTAGDIVIDSTVLPQASELLFPILEEVTVPSWYYLDDSGAVRGPFAAAQMQKWCKDGYFAPDLKVLCEVQVQGWPDKSKFWRLDEKLREMLLSVLHEEQAAAANLNMPPGLSGPHTAAPVVPQVVAQTPAVDYTSNTSVFTATEGQVGADLNSNTSTQQGVLNTTGSNFVEGVQPSSVGEWSSTLQGVGNDSALSGLPVVQPGGVAQDMLTGQQASNLGDSGNSASRLMAGAAGLFDSLNLQDTSKGLAADAGHQVHMIGASSTPSKQSTVAMQNPTVRQPSVPTVPALSQSLQGLVFSQPSVLQMPAGQNLQMQSSQSSAQGALMHGSFLPPASPRLGGGLQLGQQSTGFGAPILQQPPLQQMGGMQAPLQQAMIQAQQPGGAPQGQDVQYVAILPNGQTVLLQARGGQVVAPTGVQGGQILGGGMVSQPGLMIPQSPQMQRQPQVLAKQPAVGGIGGINNAELAQLLMNSGPGQYQIPGLPGYILTVSPQHQAQLQPGQQVYHLPNGLVATLGPQKAQHTMRPAGQNPSLAQVTPGLGLNQQLLRSPARPAGVPMGPPSPRLGGGMGVPGGVLSGNVFGTQASAAGGSSGMNLAQQIANQLGIGAGPGGGGIHVPSGGVPASTGGSSLSANLSSLLAQEPSGASTMGTGFNLPQATSAEIKTSLTNLPNQPTSVDVGLRSSTPVPSLGLAHAGDAEVAPPSKQLGGSWVTPASPAAKKPVENSVSSQIVSGLPSLPGSWANVGVGNGSKMDLQNSPWGRSEGAGQDSNNHFMDWSKLGDSSMEADKTEGDLKSGADFGGDDPHWALDSVKHLLEGIGGGVSAELAQQLALKEDFLQALSGGASGKAVSDGSGGVTKSMSTGALNGSQALREEDGHSVMSESELNELRKEAEHKSFEEGGASGHAVIVAEEVLGSM